jgi:hypothetical protein
MGRVDSANNGGCVLVGIYLQKLRKEHASYEDIACRLGFKLDFSGI